MIRPGGDVVTVVGAASHNLAPLYLRGANLHTVLVLMPIVYGRDKEKQGEILDQIRLLADQGKIIPLLDPQRFTLETVADAHRKLEAGQAFGKLVIDVETGNFTLAAQRLRLTRSAVAKSVAKLEARLGTRLFQRTTRSQSLTEAGHAYYEYSRRALSELDAADAVLAAGQTTPRGTLRISMPDLLGRTHVTPLLLELGREYPELSFDIAFSDRVVDLVEERIDLALRSGSLGDSAVLAARSLGRQWMGVYASPTYLAQYGHPLSIE
uniref:HTH lysR-type domain-containing protein n=1 Tax=Anopheles maculatus TaxID=74869 RepID=A0A182SQR8_9DIPT